MTKKNKDEVKTKLDTSNFIIQTAHRLFMENGFAGISTRMIAKECGITQPALYHHFPNKVSIYLAVLQSDLSKTEEAIHRIITIQNSIRESLLEVTTYILLNRPKNLGQINNDMRQNMNKEQQLFIRHHWTSAYLTPIEGLLQGATINEPIKHDPKHLAKLAHVYLGMVHQQLPEMDRLATVEESDIRARAEFLVSIFMDGVIK